PRADRGATRSGRFGVSWSGRTAAGREEPPPKAGAHPRATRPRSRGRVDHPEQAVALVVRTRREEQRVGGSGNAAGSELEGPEPVDRDRDAASTAQHAGTFEAAVRVRRVRVDPAVAERAD